ncbi:hypothetical protein [Neolewinella antarctica]|uniref:DoxX family protein n=1 Tax=Neolewinella antarctica TaxID=442734 RepID=A0ABX0X985_9BACT|nr:hypothetical protein [Neolewinella antarctica]NJC25566.1 hypothetical protein [Neolewinella antarctica]
MSKQKIGLILLGLVGLALIGSGIFKIIGAAEMGESFGNANVPYILAATEFAIVIALAIPKTRMLGVILGASYFGGAICAAWLIEGEFPLPAMVLNTILYVGAYLYRPSLADGHPTVIAIT